VAAARPALDGAGAAAGTRAVIATPDLVRDLAVTPARQPVLSVHLRTDPRDPANTNHAPGWVVVLRNGLRAVGDDVGARGTRDERLALRELLPRVEATIAELEPAERGRGLSFFVGVDGLDQLLLVHQLPPRDHAVRWDVRPLISPLVDLASRGRSTGLVLVGADRVHLLHWEAGRVTEPDRSVYVLELGDWREYAGYAAPNPARGQQTATHVEAFEHRVGDWRRRFLGEVAGEVAARTRALGWGRLLVAGEQPLAADFAAALDPGARRRVAGEVDANLLGGSPAEAAARLELGLEALHRRDATDLLERIGAAAAAGGPGALGAAEVLQALAEHRVEHLVVDPAADLSGAALTTPAQAAVDGAAPDLLAERAVELAVAGGADVTTLEADASRSTLDPSGIAALLRF
jgi:hypothetical protein